MSTRILGFTLGLMTRSTSSVGRERGVKGKKRGRIGARDSVSVSNMRSQRKKKGGGGRGKRKKMFGGIPF